MWWLYLIQGVLGAMGEEKRGRDLKTMAEAAARGDEYNAAVARARKEQLRVGYNAQEQQLLRDQHMEAGTRRASAAQARVGLDSGSPADIERQSEVSQELDVLNLRYRSSIEQWGEEAMANQYDYAAKVHRLGGQFALDEARLGAVSQLFSGAARAYGSYQEGQNPKLTATGASKAEIRYWKQKGPGSYDYNNPYRLA